MAANQKSAATYMLFLETTSYYNDFSGICYSDSTIVFTNICLTT